jgi:subfamily B ATP-binding cassette protein MsbA
MATSHRRTLRTLLKPHIKSLSLGAIAVLLEGAANLAEPWPLKIVLDNVLKPKPARGWLNDALLPIIGPDKHAILTLAAMSVLAIAVIGAICTYSEKLQATNVAQHVAHDLRRMAYSHVQALSLAYHVRKQTGDLIACLTTDIEAIQTFIATGLLGVFVSALTLLGMAILMFSLNWRFTLVALSSAPLLFAIVYRYTRQIKTASRAMRQKEGEITSLMQEVLSSTRVVKAFVREEQEQRRLEKESLESLAIARHARSLKVRLPPLVDVIVAAGTGLVLFVGGRLALNGMISTGSLILFVWYLSKMYKPMRDLSKITDAYAKAAIGYERITALLAVDYGVKDLPGARPIANLRGEIEFDSVSFSYEPGFPVLNKVSLKIHPGQVAALVGPTGAGKTTVVSLVARFYDPDVGSVKLDGSDVRFFQQKSLRSHISFVLQETLLFRAPVWYNIAYGKPNANRTDIIRAAELANADEFIDRLPHGYDTIIGERGETLSGGQRQRLAIARAVLIDAPILILDEAAAGLDAASERLVLEALDRLIKGKTSIIISHRLNNLRSADTIFVLDRGEIVDQGKHDDLLQRRRLYARLHDLQQEQNVKKPTTTITKPNGTYGRHSDPVAGKAGHSPGADAD